MKKLIAINEISEGESKGFELEGFKIFAVKKDGEIYVYENKCPHIGIELEYMPDQFLDADKSLIICSTHGALFEIQSGKCLSGPCQGDQLTIINHEIKQDEIWVEIP